MEDMAADLRIQKGKMKPSQYLGSFLSSGVFSTECFYFNW